LLLVAMSDLFREYVRKIGSGPHTGKNLTRAEAADAMRMLLHQDATPAQVGAFLIAHRIKRPTGEELAGMLDAYNEFGPKIAAIQSVRPVLMLSAPYDGRDRTFPLSIITAIVLAALGQPVLQHGGNRTPTKEGITLIELWQSLGVDWTGLSLEAIQDILQTTGLGFVYLPEHFPMADHLVTYRREIGKRPPIATLELIWCPYAGNAHLVAGYVHPPTEGMIREALSLHQTQQFITVKGLEGSCDLPRERTGIIGIGSPTGFERLYLHPHEHGFAGRNVPIPATENMAATWAQLITTVLKADFNADPASAETVSELHQSLLWNSSFYLWRCGLAASLEEGVAQARDLLKDGQVAAQLSQLQQTIAHHRGVKVGV
jgi:anthranilate phosphoribosyltransferase